MAGDLITTNVQYYFKNLSYSDAGSTLGPTLINTISGILNTSSAVSGALKGGVPGITGTLGATGGLGYWLTYNTANQNSYLPKAHLSVLFFDERFNFVSESSQQLRVKTAGSGAAALVLSNIKVPKNGYVLVYISNESDEPVYFDNLQVRHDRGRILEENHYYAYGLKIAALSSKAFGGAPNNYQYQGDYSEFDDDLGWNDFMLRSYDPQIGRFLQHDPYDQFASGYVGMGNDPGNGVDPSGGFFLGADNFINGVLGGAVGGALAGAFIGAATSGGNGEGFWKGFGAGFIGGAIIGAGGLNYLNIGLDIFRTAQQIDYRKVRTALMDLSDKLEVKGQKIENWNNKAKDDFKNHFGTDDDASREIIKDRIKRMQNLVNSYLKGKLYREKIYRDPIYDEIPLKEVKYGAMVFNNDPYHNVSLYKPYWKYKRGKRMGILAHELSHFNDVGNTVDYAYYEDLCGDLSHYDPEQALYNADNFRFYIQGIKLPMPRNAIKDVLEILKGIK
jgi:RHS repeat-associated protein